MNGVEIFGCLFVSIVLSFFGGYTLTYIQGLKIINKGSRIIKKQDGIIKDQTELIEDLMEALKRHEQKT